MDARVFVPVPDLPQTEHQLRGPRDPPGKGAPLLREVLDVLGRALPLFDAAEYILHLRDRLTRQFRLQRHDRGIRRFQIVLEVLQIGDSGQNDRYGTNIGAAQFRLDPVDRGGQRRQRSPPREEDSPGLPYDVVGHLGHTGTKIGQFLKRDVPPDFCLGALCPFFHNSTLRGAGKTLPISRFSRLSRHRSET